MAETRRQRWGRFRLGRGLELSALSLMVASVITALVGLVFWAVATRVPPSEVGRSSAIITTATLLSALASQNVGLLISRFLPGAGGRSAKLVLGGYAAASGVAVLLGAGFVLFFHSTLFVSDLERFLFPVFTMVLSLFVLQDWVLIGLRASTWVPLEQLIFALVKLGLLVVFIALFPVGGIVLSWVVPAALAVIVVSSIVVFRVLPRRPPPEPGAAQLPGRRALGIIFVGEYATGIMTVAVPMALPLIIVAQLGTASNAFYTLPWMLSEAFNMLLWNISSSYMVEASNDGPRAAALLRRTIRLNLLIVGLGVPFMLIGAPWLLTFLGGAYAAEGSTVLRILACAIPFLVITALYSTTARVRQQMGRVVAIQLSSALITIGLALLLVGPLGINGVALAYLIAVVLEGAVVLIPLINILREKTPAERATHAEPAPLGA
ncbi:lipopolysaccharide biosynthesis protein [Pseudonocardia sp. GCM10023141]|uniref:lipopolysaccharide biosynthesis protein n=1 Tax=Pseudonocardia sp. GCM10023141 TaxID=3252653 RepID=UPI00361DE11F